MSLRIGVLLLLASGLFGNAGSAAVFKQAQPVWIKGKTREMNGTVGLRAEIPAEKGTPEIVRITGATIYRVYVNGRFLGHGPARAAHGYARVDEWRIPEGFIAPNTTALITIEAAGYNSNSYYVIDQPSFVQAEVLDREKILAHTGAGGGFVAKQLTHRLQKVQRTSFQRTFAEAYVLHADSSDWATPGKSFGTEDQLEVVAAPKLLERGVPYPNFDSRLPRQVISRGSTSFTETRRNQYGDRSLKGIGPKLKGYPEGELEVLISNDVTMNVIATSAPANAVYHGSSPISLGTNSFSILDFGSNLTGFLRASFTYSTTATVLLSFDEILAADGDVNPLRMGMVAAIRLELSAGTHTFESIEPNTLKYLKITTISGKCDVYNIALREYANDDVWEASFASSDDRLNRIFDAGRQTFRQNSPDIFMDCPSRERAGWLCDSFFTARAEKVLTGGSAVETNFLENYVLPEKFDHLPPGMLPMCYPADHNDGNYIPNWAMWFVLELEEYAARGGERRIVELAAPRVEGLIKFFDRFLNSDGLLEKLEAWVFVEWSAANGFTQEVNYPSNMLYAAMLDAAGRLYDREDWQTSAAAVRKTIISQSYDGTFFADNAARKNGKLQRHENFTEVCQYMAFYFGVASPETFPDLWKTLREDFGRKRLETKAHPKVHKANAFVGNMIRMDLLGLYGGADQQSVDDLISYYGYMADRTSTIWENDHDGASLNHGFGGHVCATLYRDVLGAKVDTVQKQVTLRVPGNNLGWCRGRMPTPDGFVEYHWTRDNGKPRISYTVPEGYTVNLK